MSTTEELETIVTRALGTVTLTDINRDIVRASITAIANDWPVRSDVDMLSLYLVHDCRSLAKTLLDIANAAERWDEDDTDPDEMFPCVHGHFDCATEDHGPCGDEQRARNFAAQSDTGYSVDGDPING